ncbi:hypothetical protein D9M70_339390 [compost metagenome]
MALLHFHRERARRQRFGGLQFLLGGTRPAARQVDIGQARAQAGMAGRVAHQVFRALLGLRSVVGLQARARGGLLGGQPQVVGLARRLAAHPAPLRLLGAGLAHHLARRVEGFGFGVGVVQAGLGLQARFGVEAERVGFAHLAEQHGSLFGVAQVEVGRGDVAQRVDGHGDALGAQRLVAVDHVLHAQARVQRAEAVDAGAAVQCLALAVPGSLLALRLQRRQQRIVARQRAVGDGKALGFHPRGHVSQPHQFGGGIQFQRLPGRGVEQCRMFACNAQRGVGQAGALQRGHVGAHGVGTSGRTGIGLVGLEQGLVWFAGAGLRIGQRQAAVDVIRLLAHQ